jgi:hypothetical protein
MKCRKNLRVLFAEYNSASPADKPNTALMKLKNAILALKNPALHPSQLISRPDVAAAIANDIAMAMLAPGSTLVSRYDDFVWVHHQAMMQGPNDPNGPNLAHRGPAFLPWHRELLKLYEQELQNAAGDPNLTLPYWDWTKDQSAADLGFPFTTDFLGGDGAGNPNDKVTTGDFSEARGWVLNCDEEGFFFLRRHFGGDGPGLPTSASVKSALSITTYDRSPWNITSASANSFRNTLEGWVGPRGIHNAVHRWVDGSMQPGTSPNDPIFFFHHCNIDRLWAVWQQKNHTVTHYLPDDSTPAASGLTRLSDNMATFGRTLTDRYFGVDVVPADVLNSKAINWYDSDLPELNNETGGTLSFVNIPEGLTSYKAVKFKVTGCRPVHFRITGAPTGNFALTTMGTEFLASPDEGEDFFYGYVWIQLAAVAGPIPNSSVDIHAYIIDPEGYYASTEGGEYPLGDFHIGLTATTVSRENNSVALVLDRSGSMADPAGGSSTKNILLKNAVSVFNTLMLPKDEISLVSFDDFIAVPAAMQAVSAGAVPPVLTGTDLDPRGMTCIGGGILQGSTQLGLATHTNKSMLVLTDGIENVHPYVAELPAGTITNRTYAIGFGLPEDVSVAVLNQITSNTHGDLIITGNISTAEQAFNLTKYFVQVLAGVTNMNVILDPQGSLFFGSKQVVPFDLIEGDVYADIITLCPLPQLVEFFLETPSGKIINPSMAGPNIKYVSGEKVLFYRLTLPALTADAAGSHAGKWKAILSLKSKDELQKLLRNKGFVAALRNSTVGESLPYSLVAHAYSNLHFDARLQQESLKPGAAVTFTALLKEYDVPFTADAAVWVEITNPNLSTFSLKLEQAMAGIYSGTFNTSSAGVYSCRVRAEGYSNSKNKFTREKTLTAGVYYGNYSTIPPSNCDAACELLQCLVSDKVLSERAAEKAREVGIDLKALRECLNIHCRKAPQERIPRAEVEGRVRKGPQPEPTLNIKSERPSKPIERPKVKPMKMTAVVQPSPKIVRMFSLPEKAEHELMPKGIQKKSQAPTLPLFPRIIRMFSPPGGEVLGGTMPKKRQKVTKKRQRNQ